MFTYTIEVFTPNKEWRIAKDFEYTAAGLDELRQEIDDNYRSGVHGMYRVRIVYNAGRTIYLASLADHDHIEDLNPATF
jgi:hypothetical protein